MSMEGVGLFLVAMVAGAMLLAVIYGVSRSLGNSSHSLLSSTNGTSWSGNTIVGLKKNGIVTSSDGDWTALSQDAFAEDWESKEDKEAYD